MNIELIFPVLNEANSLAKQLAKVREFISKIPEYDFIITVVDNGSTDNTKSIVNKLIQENIVDKYLYLSERGRGRAIKVAINKSIYNGVDAPQIHSVYTLKEKTLPVIYVINIYQKYQYL